MIIGNLKINSLFSKYDDVKVYIIGAFDNLTSTWTKLDALKTWYHLAYLLWFKFHHLKIESARVNVSKIYKRVPNCEN